MKWAPTPIGLGSIDFVPPMLGDLTYAQAIALVTLPVCFTKNVINMVQLWKASKILVGVDLAERAKKREEKLAKK
jgi:CDP-diacylglycerol--inositol 3-phosphatidyltransferase